MRLWKIGLDVKTKHADELTEVVDITEEVDEEQQISDEVGIHTSQFHFDTNMQT